MATSACRIVAPTQKHKGEKMLPPLSDPSWKVGVIAIGLAVAVSVGLYWTMVRPLLSKQSKTLEHLERQFKRGAQTTDVLARAVMEQGQQQQMAATAPPPPPPPPAKEDKNDASE